MTWAGWSHQRFSFRRVDLKTREEGEELTQVTGGSVELSALSDIKATGTLDFDGFEAPDDRDLVRIYYGYEEKGREVFEPLATLKFSVSEPTHDGIRVSGTMDCQSVLAILASRNHGEPFTVKAGVNAVAKAVELTRSLGLAVNAASSTYKVSADYTFDADKADYLTIVNWLLETAGYSSAWVDAMGVVRFTRYVEPTERGVAVTLRDDENSIMLPQVVRRSDYAETPNVVRLLYSTDDETLVAVARNVDPSSKASVAYRGYENTFFDSVGELPGESQEERLANLKAMAKQSLLDKTMDVEHVDGRCQYVKELFPNNGVGIEYVRAGMDWRGSLSSVSVSLSGGMPTEFSARKFVRGDLMIEVSGRAC